MSGSIKSTSALILLGNDYEIPKLNSKNNKEEMLHNSWNSHDSKESNSPTWECKRQWNAFRKLTN